MSKASWVAAAVTTGYFVATAGVFWLFNVGVPRMVEQVLSLLVMPAVLLMGLWDPLLKRLGWSKGEWFAVPSVAGFVALTLFYTLLAFGITEMLGRLLRR